MLRGSCYFKWAGTLRNLKHTPFLPLCNRPPVQSNRENIQGTMRGHSDSSFLAEADVVSDDDGAVNWSSSTTSGRSRRAKDDRKAESSLPQRTSSEVNCLEIIKRQNKEAGFSEKPADLAARGRRNSTLRVYSSHLRHYFDWWDERQIDPYHASIPEIADFLESHFTEGLQVATIKGYKSTIASIHWSLPDGTKLNSDPNRSLHFIMEGMNNVRPPVRKIMPEWDLGTVLSHLSKSPYESLQSADIGIWLSRLHFLIAIASGRRGSEIHVLATGDHIVFGNRGTTLHFRPEFLAKNERSDFTMSLMFLPYLDPLRKQDRKERLICPVRALRWYLARTETARASCKCSQLFITSRKPFKPAAKSTTAGWIVTAIVKADAVVRGDSMPSAHSTRAVSSSWAFSQGLSIAEIMNTVSWKSKLTFTTRYLRDTGPCKKTKYALTVLRASLSLHH